MSQKYFTKDQELAALKKIEAILAKLPDPSYVGTAFAGCADLARENIAADELNSLSRRVENLRAESDRITTRNMNLESVNNAYGIKIEELADTCTKRDNELAKLREEYRALIEQFTAAVEDTAAHEPGDTVYYIDKFEMVEHWLTISKIKSVNAYKLDCGEIYHRYVLEGYDSEVNGCDIFADRTEALNELEARCDINPSAPEPID